MALQRVASVRWHRPELSHGPPVAAMTFGAGTQRSEAV